MRYLSHVPPYPASWRRRRRVQRQPPLLPAAAISQVPLIAVVNDGPGKFPGLSAAAERMYQEPDEGTE